MIVFGSQCGLMAYYMISLVYGEDSSEDTNWLMWFLSILITIAAGGDGLGDPFNNRIWGRIIQPKCCQSCFHNRFHVLKDLTPLEDMPNYEQKKKDACCLPVLSQLQIR